MSINKVEAILTAKDQGFSSTFEQASGVANSFGSKMKSGLGFGMWQAIGMKAINTISGAISSNLDSAISRFDTLNNFPKVMQSLGFTAEQAGANMDRLSAGIQKLPTTLDRVASQEQQIVAITGDLDKATDITLALNSAIAAGGQPAEAQANAINQWTQAMAKGKPEFEDWQAMVQVAPAQMDQLAKSMLGASATQNDLYNAMKSGAVSIDDVNAKMIELTNASDGFDIAGKHYDSFAKQAENASAGIQMSLLTISAAISRNMANVIGAIDEALADFGGLSGILASVEGPIDSFGSHIQKVIKGDMTLGEAVEEMANSVGEAAKAFIPKAGEIVGNLLTGLGAQLPQIIMAGVNLVGDLLIGIAKAIPDLIVGALNLLTGFFDGLEQGREGIFTKGIEIVKTLATGIITNLPEILQAAGRLILSMLKCFATILPQMLEAGIKLIGALIKGIASMAGQLGSYVLSLARQIPAKIKEGIQAVKTIGGDIVDGIKNGLKAKWDAMVEWFKAKADALPKAIKKVLGIASPSKVFAEIGAYTAEGFAVGIESTYRQVQSAMAGLYSLTPSGALMSGYNASLSSDYMYNAQGIIVVQVPVNLDGRQIADVVTEVQTADQIRDARKMGIR